MNFGLAWLATSVCSLILLILVAGLSFFYLTLLALVSCALRTTATAVAAAAAATSFGAISFPLITCVCVCAYVARNPTFPPILQAYSLYYLKNFDLLYFITAQLGMLGLPNTADSSIRLSLHSNLSVDLSEICFLGPFANCGCYLLDALEFEPIVVARS